jgi:hypothetical protein
MKRASTRLASVLLIALVASLLAAADDAVPLPDHYADVVLQVDGMI